MSCFLPDTGRNIAMLMLEEEAIKGIASVGR
jgi:hypothetical protein